MAPLEPRDTPDGRLVPFSPGKKELAQRAKLCKVRRAESSRPTGVAAHGDGRVRRPAPTTSQENHSRMETREGQAPLRDGGETFRGGEEAGETLQGAARRVVAPYGRHGPRGRAGQETRPYNISGKSQQDGNAGGASPSPTGWRGSIPRRRTGGRLPESSFELPWGTQAG